jgi:hypothetical protein
MFLPTLEAIEIAGFHPILLPAFQQLKGGGLMSHCLSPNTAQVSAASEAGVLA